MLGQREYRMEGPEMRRTTWLAIILMAMALSAPGALIYMSKNYVYETGSYQGFGTAAAAQRGSGSKVWLTTPAFTIRDAEGENRLFVAALKMQNREAATRICRWMPVIRDRIQTVISDVDRRMPTDGAPTLSLEKRRLQNSLQAVLASAAPSQVDFVDAGEAPGAVLRGGKPALCDGNILDDRRSRLFTG